MAKENKKKSKAIDDVIEKAMREKDSEAENAAESGNKAKTSRNSAPVRTKDNVKMTKAEKQAARAKHKQKVRAQKEWEDNIVASKRVKREENRKKWKRAMLVLLIFAMTVTSLVYVMLLFIQENNVRITASSNNQEKSISLSMDDVNWSPYLNANGPQNMTDISYNRVYNKPTGEGDDFFLPRIKEAETFVNPASPVQGNRNGRDYVAFGFSLINNSAGDDSIVTIDYGVTMRSNQKGLEQAIRIMWAENFDKGTREPKCVIYAAPSANEKVGSLASNVGKEKGQWVEKVSYPIGSDKFTVEEMTAWENSLADNTEEQNALIEEDGWFDTVPFKGGDQVFTDRAMLAPGEKVYVYVCVWIEGSDFECVDAVLGGYVSLAVNFEVVA